MQFIVRVCDGCAMSFQGIVDNMLHIVKTENLPICRCALYALIVLNVYLSSRYTAIIERIKKYFNGNNRVTQHVIVLFC